ncbi:hypothetical protein DFH09DRAFT_1071995 [Mycena vulgaris]|nr:hypothetical protein DFH09DRAFT_1071995 [Mycena vulgaris]
MILWVPCGDVSGHLLLVRWASEVGFRRAGILASAEYRRGCCITEGGVGSVPPKINGEKINLVGEEEAEMTMCDEEIEDRVSLRRRPMHERVQIHKKRGGFMLRRRRVQKWGGRTRISNHKVGRAVIPAR